jgi:hypothetical protein
MAAKYDRRADHFDSREPPIPSGRVTMALMGFFRSTSLLLLSAGALLSVLVALGV